MGLGSNRTPDARCSRTAALQAQTAETRCSRTVTLQAQTAEARCHWTGTLQTHTTKTAFDGLAPSAFDPFLEYSTGKVVLFWQPPSYFLQWSSSSFVVDGVSYSSAEQRMMAKKARRFKDNRAAELITSPDPGAHKRIGRGGRNFNSAVWDRE